MADTISKRDYQALAEFRYQIRCFLHSSEDVMRAGGIEPQQHQLLLAIKGLPDQKQAVIGELAERLQLQHHSAVELINRSVKKGLVERERDEVDQRRVFVALTSYGEAVLRALTLHHLEELRSAGPALVKELNALMKRDAE